MVPARYEIGRRGGARALFDALRGKFPTLPEQSFTRDVTYYDTFDWRLHRGGDSLGLIRSDHGLELEWSGEGEELRSALGEEEPFGGLPTELPPGRMRESISKLAGVRRLLPVVRAVLHGRRLAFLDTRQKTVARILHLRGSATDPDSARTARRLPERIEISPLRGYEQHALALAGFLEKEFGLEPAAGNELEWALAAIGRSARDYSSKIQLELEPMLRSEAAAKSIHRALLDGMLRNESGLRRDLDSEFLHDFRVAVRRTRSALGQIKEVYPTAIVERYRREFSWLGEITGPTRDLDVYLLLIPAYLAELPASTRVHLSPLAELIERRQRLEHRSLVEALDSQRYRELIQDWQEFLLRSVPDGELPANARKPIYEVASARLQRLRRRVLKRGRELRADSPADSFHRMRIDCKKLRYMLEFFRSLYLSDEVAATIRSLKRLQDNLGDLNDLEVQRDQLSGFAHELAAEQRGSVETLMTLGRLVDRLESRRLAERERFPECFGPFAEAREPRLRPIRAPEEESSA